MKIRLAENKDISWLHSYDTHITERELRRVVRLRRVYIAEEGDQWIGWLRYNLFWDNTPFMNLLYIREPYRRRGVGRRLVTCWEKNMARKGYQTLMTSTQSNEYGQHFYTKLGYEAIGGFRLDGEGYEVIFAKTRR